MSVRIVGGRGAAEAGWGEAARPKGRGLGRGTRKGRREHPGKRRRGVAGVKAIRRERVVGWQGMALRCDCVNTRGTGGSGVRGGGNGHQVANVVTVGPKSGTSGIHPRVQRRGASALAHREAEED